ncbi:MAG: hypothetical protein WAL59_29790 [Roseiarcus sp.]
MTPIVRATLFASLIAFAPMAFENSARAASAVYCPERPIAAMKTLAESCSSATQEARTRLELGG